MANQKKLPDYIVTERVKAKHKPDEGVVYEERIEAGSPGTPVALPGDPETPEQKDAAKKAASSKKK